MFNVVVLKLFSGQCNREATVNLGVGCCLLYQIAMSKNELDKIMKTRMQMEKLLEDVREELQKKDGLSKPSEMNEMCAYSTTGIADGLDFEYQLSPQILTLSCFARVINNYSLWPVFEI
jgi:hypothetical protein